MILSLLLTLIIWSLLPPYNLKKFLPGRLLPHSLKEQKYFPGDTLPSGLGIQEFTSLSISSPITTGGHPYLMTLKTLLHHAPTAHRKSTGLLQPLAVPDAPLDQHHHGSIFFQLYCYPGYIGPIFKNVTLCSLAWPSSFSPFQPYTVCNILDRGFSSLIDSSMLIVAWCRSSWIFI